MKTNIFLYLIQDIDSAFVNVVEDFNSDNIYFYLQYSSIIVLQFVFFVKMQPYTKNKINNIQGNSTVHMIRLCYGGN